MDNHLPKIINAEKPILVRIIKGLISPIMDYFNSKKGFLNFHIEDEMNYLEIE